MADSKVRMEVDARLENIPGIIDFVAGFMRGLRLDAIIFAVETSVDEACTNIIKHGYSGGAGTIAIACEMQGDDFVVTIIDRGKPFDPSAVSPPDLGADLEKRKVGGLGLHLMNKLMDNVIYTYTSRDGNRLVMRKRRQDI